MRIAQVAVRSPLGCLVPKLLSNSKALQQTQVSEYRLAIARFLLHSNFSRRFNFLVCKAPTQQGSGAHAYRGWMQREVSPSFAIQDQEGPLEKWE